VSSRLVAVMPDFDEAVVSQLSALVERGEVASVAFAVVAGTDVRSGGFGGVDPDSVFQIGSVTKAFTGLLLADSVARGEVELADLATNYLPGASPGRVTLVELATHTSGLPRLPRGMLRYALLRPRNPYAWYPERSFLRTARRSLATAPGGQPYAYSNFGAALLGYLLGEAAQIPYQRLIEERICRPLAMSATSFDARPVQGYSNGRKVPPWHLGPMPAAGGLSSTVGDMAKLLTACLRPPGTALAESAPLALATHAVLGPREEIGLGWHHALRDDRRVSWHNGMTGGYSSMIALDSARQSAVVALANRGTPPPSPLDAAVMSAIFAA
jgi:D-alanyl-D-alanine-carboxypeptidase/D-alanyl-D-alanine-endopeptidase